MQVLFNKSIASDVFSFRPGQIANIPEELAKKWVISEICELVPEPKKEKKAEAPKK
jgi:hypothetical protein